MPISFQCSQCSRTFTVPDDKAGKKTRCRCGAAIQVPEPVVPSPTEIPIELADPLLGGMAAGPVDPLAGSTVDPLLGGPAAGPADPLAENTADPLGGSTANPLGVIPDGQEVAVHSGAEARGDNGSPKKLSQRVVIGIAAAGVVSLALIVGLLLLVIGSDVGTEQTGTRHREKGTETEGEAIDALYRHVGTDIIKDRNDRVVSVVTVEASIRDEVDLPDFTDNTLAHLKSFKSLRELNLNATQITDDGLVHVSKMTGLHVLIFTDTGITDAGLIHLKGLTNLRELRLNTRGPVRDKGLIHLQGLTNLETLDLGWTDITDAGLVHLKGLTNLKTLDLHHTKITDVGLGHLKELTNLASLEITGIRADAVTKAGVDDLQKALPDCSIDSQFR